MNATTLTSKPISPGHLHLLCGKMASGKSTLAQIVSEQESAIRLEEDTLLAGLFPGEISDIPSYVKCSNRMKSALRVHFVQLLKIGVSVVLDFPSNTREQRRWLLDVALEAGADHTLHYLERTDLQCLAQLKRRRVLQPERQGTDTPELFHAITKYFEPPAASEGFSIIIHRTDPPGLTHE
ncbi:MAG: AAA family ATPase [Burkholderiaceae bacterium]